MKYYPKQIDQWVWGKETIIWGDKPDHKYTFKLLEPKVGRQGMLSLQSHHSKSESWFQLKGQSWALVITDEKVCTRILKPGDIQNLPTGTIHRLMGLTTDCQVLEPSTPDAHAADKSVAKDIIRYHCVLGRETITVEDQKLNSLIQQAISVSEKAILDIENGKMPEEINLAELMGDTGFRLC
jgi:hypothetical protein